MRYSYYLKSHTYMRSRDDKDYSCGLRNNTLWMVAIGGGVWIWWYEEYADLMIEAWVFLRERDDIG